MDANYVLFPGGLDAAWETDGPAPRPPTVTDSEGARAPTTPGSSSTSTTQQLYVTGFVQNGDLIQTVDAVDPTPFDAGAASSRGRRARSASSPADAEASRRRARSVESRAAQQALGLPARLGVLLGDVGLRR